MTESSSGMLMFIAHTLMDGIEDLANITGMLNYRGIGGWRNARTSDFRSEDVALALETLISQGSIDAWRLGSDGYLTAAEGNAVAILGAAQADPGAIWFRLTTKGREAVEAWKPPRPLDRVLVQYLHASPSSTISLHFAYQLLNQSLDEQLDFAEFEDFINGIMEYD